MPRSRSHSNYFTSSPLSTPPSSPQKISGHRPQSSLDGEGDVTFRESAMDVDPNNEDVYEVEAIVARKGGKDGKRLLYRIRWVSCD